MSNSVDRGSPFKARYRFKIIVTRRYFIVGRARAVGQTHDKVSQSTRMECKTRLRQYTLCQWFDPEAQNTHEAIFLGRKRKVKDLGRRRRSKGRKKTGEKGTKLPSATSVSWPATRARIERDIFTSVPVFARKRGALAPGGKLSE